MTEQPPTEQPTELAHQHPLHGRVAGTAAVLALIGSLAGWGWFASENAREAWWTFGQHVAVGPDEQGWATVGDVSVQLTGSHTFTEVADTAVPAGFVYLVLDFEVRSEDIENNRSCDVEVRDSRGRLFEGGRGVPSGSGYSSTLECGTSDPEEDPVPTDQSVLVLVPADAELESVWVTSIDFPPATFAELPLP